MNPQPLLKVDNLKTWLRSGGETIHAVDGVSFTVNRGETLCLVGESGSGKSVCALSIIQLLPKRITSHPAGEIAFNLTNGTHEVETVDLLKQPESVLCDIRGARISMIFQEPMTSLNPVFTIGEQISEALRLHNPGMSVAEAREAAIDALKQVKLQNAEQRLDEYPHRLSGGQRQRVMIAMAMACKPDLLIADEPTTALDVIVQAEILKLMRELQDQTGMGILFITHDFGVVSRVADRVAVMRQGKIVENSTLQKIMQSPEHAYTQALLRALPENLPRPESRFQAASSDSKPLMRLNDLKVWFPVRKGVFRQQVDNIKAVDGVDLKINRGEIVALVGESGCGKSTLGRAIIQLEKAGAGEVFLGETELTGLDRAALKPYRRSMQIIFQDPMSSLNPRLTVATTLTEPMKVHGVGSSQEERVALAQQVLENVQLHPDNLWRYPHEFSGGQRQRIGIARALVLEPQFIVCDEVTSALDVSVQSEILDMLLSLRDSHKLTLLFITHDIGVVEFISDRTVVMQKGQVVEQGVTNEVCGNPKTRYTQALLDAVPRLSARYT